MISTVSSLESVGSEPNAGHKQPAAATLTASPPKTRKPAVTVQRRHRPSDILVLPPSPRAEDIIIVRMAQQTAFLPSPRLRHHHNDNNQLSVRPKPLLVAATKKRPRILLSTKNFKWVKTDDAGWVKVPLASRKRRIVLKKGQELH